MNSHWPIENFGELADFKNELNFRSNENGKQVYVLGVGDFQNRSEIKDVSKLPTVPLENGLANSEILQDGDLVFVRSNGNKALVGRCVIVFPKDEKIGHSGFTIRARIKSNKILPQFVSLLMQNGLLRTALYREGAGTNISNLNQEILAKLAMPTPPLPEQIAIADLLSTWDQAIEKTERLIAAKERGFRGLVGELINKRCSNWPNLKAQDIFEPVSEKNNDNEELLSVTQDRGVIPRSHLDGRVMSPEGTTDGYKLIRKGDFAISLRSFQGGIEYSNYQGLISPAYTVLRPKLAISTAFYRHFFKTYLFVEKYLRIAVVGIRDGKQVNVPDFMTVKIPCPEIPKQSKIAELLDMQQKEIELLKKQSEYYRQQKRGLMQKLLTGAWRVKTNARS